VHLPGLPFAHFWVCVRLRARFKHATIASGVLMFVFVLMGMSAVLLIISARLATKSPALEGWVPRGRLNHPPGFYARWHRDAGSVRLDVRAVLLLEHRYNLEAPPPPPVPVRIDNSTIPSK
jgi:hypothetical protein